LNHREAKAGRLLAARAGEGETTRTSSNVPLTRAKGILTDEEFEAKKKQILGI